MALLQWCKLQLGCLLVLVFIGIVYILKGRTLMKISGKRYCTPSFDFLFALAEVAVLFDGITACAVNYTDQVPRTLNLLLHSGMYLSYEAYIAVLFYYWLGIVVSHPKKLSLKAAIFSPLFVIAALTLIFLPRTAFLPGDHTFYSMGISVYLCFGCIILYSLLTLGLILVRRRHIQVRKLKSMSWVLVFIGIILCLQLIFPQCLLSSLAITMVTITIYINMENTDIKELEHYHHEMITGFATLVDNKDDSTGGHIIRSSAYAVLIAKNLRKQAKYRHIITGDFLKNLNLSAPMHDIGKIGIPDAILQKPGKLTPEEFDRMKEHPVIGARIIRQTFSHLGRGEYENMAYEIALYHHEKWNGKGYPEGLSGETIPLCARIMAVADVFDAVSAKRCYRDAMPLEKCYAIITGGRGTDFDPDMVDAFMLDIDRVEEIYRSQNHITSPQ